MLIIDDQTWYCPECGKGGDVINFVMHERGCSFNEALKFLAEKAMSDIALENQDSDFSR